MAKGPALLHRAFGPAVWAEPDLLQTPCSVVFPCAAGHGLHETAVNPAFMQRFLGNQELHNVFVHKRTLQLILAALYVRACLLPCMPACVPLSVLDPSTLPPHHPFSHPHSRPPSSARTHTYTYYIHIHIGWWRPRTERPTSTATSASS